MKIKNFKTEISKLKEFDKNPRKINKEDFEDLISSLKEFPDMQQIREIVIDEDFKILGGHMRVKAMQKIGETKVFVKQVIGWTKKQKEEFVIKDNVNQGHWDRNKLKSDWSNEDLKKWGGNTFFRVLPWEENLKAIKNAEKETKKMIDNSTDYDSSKFIKRQANKAYEERLKNTKINENLKKVFECRINQCVEFNFDQLAKYYRSSDCSDEERDLMEDLYLVYITPWKAFEKGILEIDQTFGEIIDRGLLDYGD